MKVQAEIDEVMGDGNVVGLKELGQLKWLECCIKVVDVKR